MFDYSKRIERFRDEKVRLSEDFLEKLYAHRQANRDRIKKRLPDFINGVHVAESDFKPQGSVAVGTIIQTKYVNDEYDIDDGLLLDRSELRKVDGSELTAPEVKERLRDALKDERFNRQPRIQTNCVRVFYADTDEEKHHVDFPAYRVWMDERGVEHQELASEKSWTDSDPTQVNAWFLRAVETRNAETGGRGTQFRHLVQLLKRFCRSRTDDEWDMPNGMKLTMLVHECQPAHFDRIDVAFRTLLENLERRLRWSKVIRNLAHPQQPAITKTDNDTNVVELLTHSSEALSELRRLDSTDNNNADAARKAWDWVFRSDGFFKQFDDEEAEKEAASSKETVASRALAATATVAQSTSRAIFRVTHRQAPSWLMRTSRAVSIRATYCRDGFRTAEFRSDSTAIPKHCSLRFEADTDVPRPFKVYWQVVNTGAEAEAAGGLRGEFYDGLMERGGLVRKESTLYRGSHWIECFIVRDGVCVARSGEFVVNIEGS